MRKTWLLLLIVILVFVTSIAFSALSQSLSISSEVRFRPLTDIRVTDVQMDTASGATISYASNYSKDTVSNGFVLPTAQATISYRVTVENSGDVDYAIYDIVDITSPAGLSMTVSGYNMRDIIQARTSVVLIFTYTTTQPSENVINVVHTLNYKRVYYVDYVTGTNLNIPQQTKYAGVDINLSNTQPTKTSYTFDSWNTESDGTGTRYNSGALYTVDSDATLYAQYNADTYNITYVMNNGTNSANNPSTYTIDSSSITLDDATKTLTFKGNYNETVGANADSNSGVSIGSDTTQVQTFAGWTGNGTTTATTGLVLPTGSSGNKEFTAHWTAVAGTVPTISRTGYDCGWSTSSSGTTVEIVSGGSFSTTMITEGMSSEVNLYGVCTQTTFTVTYNTTENGGSGTIPAAHVDAGDPVNLTPTATKTGWTFVGWNTDKNATSALSSLTMGNSDLTLYAIYRKESINLVANWNANGATLSSSNQSSCTLAAVYNNAVQDTSCEVTAPTITRSGYDIIGFNTTSTATINNSSYDTTTGKLTLTSSNTGNTWYAITRSQTPYTATFASNNGATVAESTRTCYLYNNSNTCVVEPPIVTAQQGFSHIGFNTSASATTNNSSYTLSTNKLSISSNSTWYPITKSDTQYTGTFTIQDTNAATKSGGVLSCYRYNGATDCQITAPTLTAQPGYTAVGWDTNQNSSTASYSSGASILINQDTDFYSITYYNTSLTITFNKNASNSRVITQTPSGGVATADTTVSSSCTKMNGATTCTITSPTMDVSVGYHAVGYNTVANAAISTWNENTDKSMEFDATYYAITAPNTYTIHYNANCPSGITPTGSMSDQSMTYGVAANLTANGYDCPGRVFKGWTTNAEGTGTLYQDEESVNNLTPTHEATVNMYGVWRYQEPSPTMSGGGSKIYGTYASTLTCNENTTYPSGTDKYYSFGYTTASGGTPDNWTTASTTNTLSIAANAYVGVRYYSCRVYATNGVEESDTIVSSNSTTMTINNAMITYNAGNCGTISGTNPSYVNNSMTGVYTGLRNTTVGSIPTVNKTGYTFAGWYANDSGNLLVDTQLGVYGVASSYSEGVYTMDKSVAYAGYYVPEGILEDGKTYELSFNIKKVSGTFVNIGGHSEAGTQLAFTIDGNNSSYTFHTPTSNMSSNDDTNVHSVYYKFKYHTGTSDDKIFIQPNRGGTPTPIVVEISNLVLRESTELPSGYTQLDYIEGSAIQYIDTGYKPTTTTGVEIDYQYTNTSPVQQRLFGSGTTDTNYLNYQMYINGASKWAYAFVDGTGNWVNTGIDADTNRHKVYFNTTNGKLTIDSTTLDIASSTRTKTAQNNMRIMSASNNDNRSNMRVYSFKVYSNNNTGLVRDYVPCINNSTGVVGLYDLVNGTFYGNSGSGQFVIGKEQKVIESDGTINASVPNWTASNRKWLLKDNRELIASCTLNTYSITYNLNGGTVANANPTSYTYETAAFTLNNPTKPGYTFAGWSGTGLSGSANTSVTVANHSTGNRTYTANWTANSYTVTYDGNRGTIPSTSGYTVGTNGDGFYYASKSVTFGGTYGTMPSPTRTGYAFGGWFNAFTYGNLTIAASTSNNYNYKEIDYNIQPGVTYTVTIDNATRTAGSATQFTMYLYDFTDNAVVANANTAFGTSRTITLACSASANRSHKIRMLIYAGVSGSTANNAVTYTNIKIGTTGTTTATQYTSSSTVSTARNHAFIAKWTANTYTVKYNGNGNTGGSTANSSHTYDVAKALTSNGFTKTGYTFTGWSTATGAKNLIYDNSEFSGVGDANSSVDFKTYTVNGPFASGEVYQLDFDAKGSGTLHNYFWGNTNYLGVASGTNSAGGSVRVTDGENSFTVTSSYAHYWVRFTLGSSGDGSVAKKILFRKNHNAGTVYVKNVRLHKVSSSSYAYSNGQSVKNLTSTNGATINLYAIWRANTYTVTFNANGGSVGTSSKTVTYNSTYGTLPTATKSGCTFVGWYGSDYKDHPMYYYADVNPDVKNAFGYNEASLWNHWINYGKNEGRRVAPYLAGDTVNITSNTTIYAGWHC